MFCINCGKQLDKDAKFCTACGTPTTCFEGTPPSPAPSQQPAQMPQQPAQPARASKGLGTGAIIGIIVGAVAVVAIVVCAVLFLTGVIGGTPAEEEAEQALSADIMEQGVEERGADVAESLDEVDEQLAFKGMTKAEASSTLPTGGVNTKDYSASNVLDGDTDTVWCEGDSGDGTGETITLSSDSPQAVSGFRIWSGYHESLHLYDINARPHKIRVTANGEEVVVKELNDAKLAHQEVKFPEPVVTDSITIEILSVYDGSKYDDCCISEIKCY